MILRVTDNEVFGLIKPQVDAHVLGISVIAGLLKDCGYRVCIGDAAISRAVSDVLNIENISLFIHWIKSENISRIGFSYRLDPQDAQMAFGKIYYLLKKHKLFLNQGGVLKKIYFAGLPEACARIQREYNNEIPVFIGGETQTETLRTLGVPDAKIPLHISRGSKYDDDRLLFAKNLLSSGAHHYVLPPQRYVYPTFGTFEDTVIERIKHNRKINNPPLMRVHVGPYDPNYEEAKKEFKSWLKILANSKFLDIVSIGPSQLSQSDFGMDWGNKPNGGGVPINSEQDFYEIWEASRPMLVRTYAGTRNIPRLARIYEKTINMAWHALSFWWFNQIDGRGPYTVRENLEQHIETLKFIAKTGKPFEPNIPHHFSFRGGDDYTYVLSAYLAAITAKKMGIRYLILQTMLNTPRYTWGVQDLAKARALLILVRELEDRTFSVFLQPRAGLDYFSPDLEKAKVQLAAVSAMMVDIEPQRFESPDIIHVVSYSEACTLATPEIINESIQITLHAINEYRKQQQHGFIDDMRDNKEVNSRTLDLINEVKSIRRLIEKHVRNPYSAESLYDIFQKGIMPVPYLWEGREKFKEAVKWNTGLVNGSVKIIDENGKLINPTERVRQIFSIV